MKENIGMLSNAEIRIILKEMENEYEALKVKVKNHLERMDALSNEYNKTKSILSSRSKNLI